MKPQGSSQRTGNQSLQSRDYHPSRYLLRQAGGHPLAENLLPVADQPHVIGVALGIVSGTEVLIGGRVLRGEESVQAAETADKPTTDNQIQCYDLLHLR